MKLLFKLAGVLVLVASLGTGWVWLKLDRFANSPISLQQARAFDVAPGSGVARIARELAAQGVIDDARAFVWLARWRQQAHRLQAGEYWLQPGLSGEQLLALLVAGKVRQHVFTIVEGWTFRQLRRALAAEPRIRHSLTGLSDAEVMARLGHPGEHPEGRFLPDTYHFPAGTRDVDFLQRAYQAMAEALERLWPQRQPDLPLASPYEALILASIVEKETAVAAERRQIAGVFIRRLRKGMRLQTDPTVIYGLGEDFQGNLRKRDLRRDTPYNTYRRRGLPPTPIALPGLDSLRAVLDPAPGEALYFVAKGDGRHHFSATLEEHNRAVRRYQIHQRRTDYRSTPETP